MQEKYTFAQIDRICAQIEEKMNALQYDSESIRRYAILMEEALIKWRDALGEEKELAFESKEKRGWVEFCLSADGERVYPFLKGTDEEDPVALMHDRLLSGTGSEVRYRYRRGVNCLTLSLPVKDHEKELFYHNARTLALPAAIQALLTTLITVTDSLLLGFLDQNSLSAISLTAKFINLFNMIVVALVTGTTIFASQCWGKRDWKGLSRVFTVSVKASSAVSLVFFCVSFFLPRQTMGLYTNVPDLIDKGSEYLRIVSCTFLMSGFFQVYYSVMRNMGRIVRCTVYQIGSALFNCALDVILIFGLMGFPQLGIRGAAIGSIAASVLQFALCLYDLKSSSSLHFLFRDDDPGAKKIMLGYFRQSLPLVLHTVLWTLGDNVVASVIGHMDSDIIAAAGVANTVGEVAAFLCAGVYNTCGILVGNKLGKGELEMAKTYSHRYLMMVLRRAVGTFLLTCLINVFVEVLPLQLTPQAFRDLHIFLVMSAFTLSFQAMNRTLNFAGFFAGGDTVALTVIDLINIWIIIVPVGLLGMYVLKLPAIALALFLRAHEITSFPFKLIRYKQYKWLRQLPTK